VIPDISFLTSVELPAVLDLKDYPSVVTLLSAFVAEERDRNKRYLGLFLLGSIAEGSAVGGSDIDILHVIRPSILQRPYQVTQAISHRLKAVVQTCFKREIDECQNLDIGTKRSWPSRAERLNKYSIPIGMPDRVVAAIQRTTEYHQRDKYQEIRRFKAPSPDLECARYRYPDNNTFPRWAEYALLEPIK
jgi:hypothetical protein